MKPYIYLGLVAIAVCFVLGPLAAGRVQGVSATRIVAGGGATATATPCAQAGSWSQQAPYPIAIAWHAVASQGGMLYSFGGIVNNVSVANAYRYDPGANAWTQIAPLPGPRSAAS